MTAFPALMLERLLADTAAKQNWENVANLRYSRGRPPLKQAAAAHAAHLPEGVSAKQAIGAAFDAQPSCETHWTLETTTRIATLPGRRREYR